MTMLDLAYSRVVLFILDRTVRNVDTDWEQQFDNHVTHIRESSDFRPSGLAEPVLSPDTRRLFHNRVICQANEQ